jgi:hypothetical protein
MAIITARFAGLCRDCGKSFQAGDRVRWDKGAGRGQRGAHLSCPAAAAAAQPAAANTAESASLAAMYPGATIGTFDSAHEFIERVTHPLHPDRQVFQSLAKGTYGAEWLGVAGDVQHPSLAAVAALADTGWQRGVDRITEAMEGITDAVTPKSVRRRRVWSDQGDALDIHRVYSGQLDTAWTRTVRSPANARILQTVVVDSLDSGGVSADVIFWRGAAVVTLADRLQAAGYAVEVVSAWTGKVSSTGERMVCRVVCKPHSAPLDLPTLAATVACPAFFRMLGHAWQVGCSRKPPSAAGMQVDSIRAQPGEILCPKTIRDADTARAWVNSMIAELEQRQAA